MECAFLLIWKCVFRIIYLSFDMFLKQHNRVGVMSLPLTFYPACFLEKITVGNYLGMSPLAVFLSRVLLR